MTPCEIIYNIGSTQKKYGDLAGICRITGKESLGINFNDWVKDTFTDHGSLKVGTIISNEALFCFDEASEIIQSKTGKDKLQRFRTYSHVVINNEWFCFTKAHKKEIFEAIKKGAEIVCLTDSGQKHVLFKHKIGFWQLDELFVKPDLEFFLSLHSAMTDLMKIGFNQSSIIEGNYNPNFIQNFKDFLGERIIEEKDIVSDVFNNKPIKILKIKVGDNDFRLIYELNSADRLRVM